MKVAVIGGGTMGEAIIKSILQKKLADEDGITVSDVAEARRDYLKKRYGVNVTHNNGAAVKGADSEEVCTVSGEKAQGHDHLHTEGKLAR